ncbi:hypothetical protein [Halovivax limisalsi]|uniref:hypothetical protein n=1 Tax=Halovivax limisalsi TaxID=1453760 RepID=UPI001FFCC4D1|nr:hypothetical protein [Halovivax limisalsi]
MRYFVTSNDPAVEAHYAEQLEAEGYDVNDSYHEGAIIIAFGGDGTILHAARQYQGPTILPIRSGDSVGEKTQFDAGEWLDAVERVEHGRRGEAYEIERRRCIAAYRDGAEIQGGFHALNEISLHHSSPVLAATFAVRIDDRGQSYEFERLIGDGVLVATPFGSTGYYRSITGGTVSCGLGVAFNNVHTPMDAPRYVHCSPDATVTVEVIESEHSSEAVLTRDNAEELYELRVNEPITIRQSDRDVELVRPPTSKS